MSILKHVPTIVVAIAVCVSAAAADLQTSGLNVGPPAVYTESNAAAGNEILVFRRERGGDLRLISSVPTGGRGTDAGLGNQGALVLTRDGRRLYAVNAASNDISVFAANPWGLTFLQRISSGGAQPISLTLHGDILYVLNAGDANMGIAASIAGFHVGDHGSLQALANSTRPLSTAAPGPAQITFSPWGDVLVVTEKNTNKIDLYDVEEGFASTPFVHPSNGATPFGFAFDRRGHLIVSEAFGGAANASALSSYDFDDAGDPLEVISGSERTLQTAACWVAISKDGRFAYTTNTGSGTISGYRISRSGRLALLDANGITASTGAGSSPLDLALSSDGRFVFSLNGGVGTISSFKIRADGHLVSVSTEHGIPGSASGLAAH